MKKTIRTPYKYVSALLVFALVLMLTIPVFAAADQWVAATTRLNVRSGPGTGYSIVGVLSTNEVVKKTGTSGSWAIIEFNGRKAYAHANYLKSVSSPSEPVYPGYNDTVYATARVNVRQGPGTNYKILSTLQKGDAVTAIGTNGTWTIISWGSGTKAYVSSQYLTAGTTTAPTPNYVTSASGTMVATGNVNVRSGPGTNYQSIGVLVWGDTVERTGIIGDWTQVKFFGYTAYIHSSYLRVYSGGSTTPQVGYWRYVTANTIMRSGPGTNYTVVDYLARGNEVYVIEDSNNTWAKVTYQNRTGYVPWTDLSGSYDGGSSASSGIIYATSRVPVYASASTRANVLGYMTSGDSLTIVSSQDGFYRVSYSGSTGYVLASDIVVLTSTAASGFKSDNTYVTARSQVNVYLIPSANSAYLYGMLESGGSYLRVAYNDTWSKITSGDKVFYVRNQDLV